MGRDLQLRVLFVSPYAPNRVRTRPFHLIKALAALGHRVTLATVCANRSDRADVDVLRPELDGAIVEDLTTVSSLVNCLRALPSGEPLQAHYCWNAELARRVVAAARGGAFDVVHVEHLRGVKYGLAIAEALRSSRTAAAPVIWDSVDCISLLFEHASEMSPALRTRLAARLELGRTRRFEGRLASSFAGVAVTSELDRDALLELDRRWRNDAGRAAAKRPAPHVRVVPNGVDLEYFRPVAAESEKADAVVFSGKMSYHANAAAVRRLVDGVMPRIWAKRPSTELWIVGKDPGPEIRALGVPSEGCEPYPGPRGDRRVKITGTVEDMRPYLQRAAIAVAPLRYAVGIQNKVLEAMACGTPVVVSDAAARSLAAQPHREIFVGSSNSELAGYALALLDNERLRRQTAVDGRRYVENLHDWLRIAGDLEDLYGSVRERAVGAAA